MASLDYNDGKPFWKEPRGTFLVERKEHRHERIAAEDDQKELCRRRDGRCRYPDCPFCRRYRDLIPQAAHVVQAKGMSGDRTLERSTVDKLMLLCPPTHGLQEQHLIDVRPLNDEDGTNGPCEFWKRETQEQPFYLVARETAPFIYERD